MVPGIIVTLSVAATVLYTSLNLWKFCLKHPEVRDICDIGRVLFGGSQVAYNITSVFFILNNTFIQGTLISLLLNYFSHLAQPSMLSLVDVSLIPSRTHPSALSFSECVSCILPDERD